MRGFTLRGKIREHIARYEHARSKLSDVLASDDEPTHDIVSGLDNELSAAFDSIFKASAENTDDALDRIQFLVQQINETCEQDSLVQLMTDKISKDVQGILAVNNPDEHRVLQQSEYG